MPLQTHISADVGWYHPNCGRGDWLRSRAILVLGQFIAKISMEYRRVDLTQLVSCPLVKGKVARVDDSLVALARTHGQRALDEIKVRPAPIPGHYEVVRGLRSWLVAQRAGIMTVTVCVDAYDDTVATQFLSLEPGAIAGTDPVTRAEHLRSRVILRKRTHPDYGYADAGAEEGLSPTQTSHLIRLLALPKEIRNRVRDGKLPARVARLLVTLSHDQQVAAVNYYSRMRRAADGRATGRRRVTVSAGDMEAWVQAAAGRLVKKTHARVRDVPPTEADRPAWVAMQERQLSAYLQTPAVIHDGQGGAGEVVIRYFSHEELDCFYQRIRFHPT